MSWMSSAILIKGLPWVRFSGMMSSVSLPCHHSTLGSQFRGIITIISPAPTIHAIMPRVEAQKQMALAIAQYLLSYRSKKSVLFLMMCFAFLILFLPLLMIAEVSPSSRSLLRFRCFPSTRQRRCPSSDTRCACRSRPSRSSWWYPCPKADL